MGEQFLKLHSHSKACTVNMHQGLLKEEMVVVSSIHTSEGLHREGASGFHIERDGVLRSIHTSEGLYREGASGFVRRGDAGL